MEGTAWWMRCVSPVLGDGAGRGVSFSTIAKNRAPTVMNLTCCSQAFRIGLRKIRGFFGDAGYENVSKEKEKISCAIEEVITTVRVTDFTIWERLGNS